MTTRKFFCHYIGNDDKPKRRSIELTSIADIIPSVKDKLNTVWLERNEQPNSYSDRVDVCYIIYHQLSDNVAVLDGSYYSISEHHVKDLNETDEQIRERRESWFNNIWCQNFSNASSEAKERQRKQTEENIQRDIRHRSEMMERMLSLHDYLSYLLNDAKWVNMADLAACKEARPDIYQQMLEKRKQCEEARRQAALKREEERKAREAEEERKRKEEEAAEEKRLAEEEQKFKQGESISGWDVVDLCRKHNIDIHLRTVHNLQQVVTEISGKLGECRYRKERGKRSPKLDGCFDTARKLYKFLNEQNQ